MASGSQVFEKKFGLLEFPGEVIVPQEVSNGTEPGLIAQVPFPNLANGFSLLFWSMTLVRIGTIGDPPNGVRCIVTDKEGTVR